jgi:hypothetical protein
MFYTLYIYIELELFSFILSFIKDNFIIIMCFVDIPYKRQEYNELALWHILFQKLQSLNFLMKHMKNLLTWKVNVATL